MSRISIRKKPLTIRFQILLICILSLFIMQLLLMFNYYQFKKIKIESNDKAFADLITQFSDSVELNCDYLDGMVENIAYSKMVQDYLSTDSKYYLHEHYDEIKSFIISFADINTGIKDIAVIGTNGATVNLNADIGDLNKVVEEIPEKVLWYYTGLHDITMYPFQKSQYISVGTNIYSTSDFTQKGKIGTVLITFNIKSIFGFSHNQKNTKMTEMLIYDRNNQLVYSSISEDISTTYDTYFNKSGKELADTIQQKSGTYYIKTGDLKSLGGKIVFLIPEDELLSGLESNRYQTLMNCIVVLVFMFLLSLLVTNSIVVPIKQFMNYLDKVSRGDLRMLKKPIRLKGAAEIMVMSDAFNRMMEEINDLNHRLLNTSARLYESELAKRQAELEYMHSQINPHFLFNTLETIKGCAVEEDANKTFQMMNSLGKMFRYCVRSGNIVSLEEEINVIDSYMFLQKIRFGPKLTFVCNINEALYDASIPKMILQPLIENAVIHGIEEKGAISVYLEGEVENNILYFHVKDDGAGIEEERRLELMRTINDKTGTNHIGISNVHQRLKYIYGEEFGIYIVATYGQGFCVTVRFPYKKLQIKNRSEKGFYDNLM